jgi:VCBS repeat-containing protein
MISLPSVRKGLKNLSLAGLAAAAVATVAYAATQGFPFTEDFTADNLKDPATSADWDTTAPGTLRLGFATDLTGMTLARAPLGDAGEVVTYSRDIVVGDIDGDGDLDAVVGNEGANSSGAVNSIYLNNNGAFDLAPASLGSDSRRTRGMAIGDLDRDGDLDIVAGNFQGRNVYHLNDGAGNFAAAVEVAARSGNTWRVHLADVDGDADLDVIESMSDDRNFLYVNQFMENGGTLSFATSVAITSENFRTRSLALGDIDKDGDTDFIAGDQNVGNHIYRWFNGSFRARGEVHANTNITFALSLADVDGDGWLDLVEGNALAPTQIYLNQGVGNPGFFNAPVSLADSNASHTTVSLITRDMDRDGDIDIVEGNNGAWDDDGDLGAGETCAAPGASTPCIPQPVRLYLNNGDGTFANGIDFQPPEIQKIYGSAAGDFDGDGQLDFVTAHYATNPSGPDALASNAVYFNNGTPTANSVRQLDSMALSLEVSGGGAAIPAARLSVSKAQPAYLADVDFFLSNDGVTFVPAAPGAPVAFPDPNGSQLYWKADMLTASPNATQLAEISQISITANASPNFTDIGDINGVQGQALTPTSLSLYFSDPDGDTLAYQISGLPAGTGVVLDSGTGVISGTPTNADANASPITLSATAFDGAAGRTGQITLNVTNVDEVPTANDDGPYAVDEGGAIASTFNVLDNDTDPDGQALNAVLVTPPAESALFELKPDGTFDYTHNGSETTTDSFTYSANDGTFSSAPATVTITITPVNDAPVITLLGDATVDVKQGDVYNDAGASASDAEDDDISADIVVGGDAVDTGTPGAYVITYDVTDSGGLAATQVTRTVNVNEDMPPVITLVGNAAVTLTVGNVYNEQGATASDPEDGDISANIVIGGDAVNTAAAGTYTVTYNVMDSFGNSAAEVTRTVTVNAAPEPPPPPKKSGGGAAGLLEIVGLLMLTGLILFRRRRARNPIA